MKVNKRIFVVGGLVLGATGLFATAARAGLRNNNQVQIFSIFRSPNNSNAIQASGSLGAARASTDSLSYIGCQTSIDINVNAIQGVCWARTPTRRVECTISANLSVTNSDDDFIEQMRSVGPQSYIEFTYLGSGNSGTCTSLLVANTSQELPPTP